MYTAKGLKTGQIYMISNSRSTLMMRLCKKFNFKAATNKNSPQGYKEGYVYPEALVISKEEQKEDTTHDKN